MAVYTATLGSVFVFSFLADYFRFRSPTTDLDGRKKPYLWLVLVVILALSLVSGLRFMVGTDYVNYSITYDDIRTGGYAAVAETQIEWGFALVCSFFGIFYESPFAMIFFVAVLTNTLIILGLRESSSIFWLSCTLYILQFIYFSTFNIVRQSCAMAILLFGTRFIEKGEFFKYLLVALLASTFHTSALIMIPVYFVVRMPAWSTVILVGFAGCVAVFFLYDTVVGALFAMLDNTRYAAYEEVVLAGERSSNMLRLAVAAFPVALSFLFRKRLAICFPRSNIAVNMTAISLMGAIMAMKEIYFARISVYFSIYNLLTIPYFVGIFEEKKVRFFVTLAILTCYTAYCYILMPTEAGILPYQTVFSAPTDWNVMDYIFTR